VKELINDWGSLLPKFNQTAILLALQRLKLIYIMHNDSVCPALPLEKPFDDRCRGEQWPYFVKM
jgi:hypothetical protein